MLLTICKHPPEQILVLKLTSAQLIIAKKLELKNKKLQEQKDANQAAQIVGERPAESVSGNSKKDN